MVKTLYFISACGVTLIQEDFILVSEREDKKEEKEVMGEKREDEI